MSDVLGNIASKKRIWLEIIWLIGALILFICPPLSITLLIIAMLIAS